MVQVQQPEKGSPDRAKIKDDDRNEIAKSSLQLLSCQSAALMSSHESRLGIWDRAQAPAGCNRQHQADAVKRLEVFNAAKEIAEFEKRKKQLNTSVSETVPTVFPTQAEITANSSHEKTAVN
jgi:hypothetical protein